MDREYLTVKEFALAAGVTVQAIYPRLERDLKPYFKIENGQKLIDKAGLELFKKAVSFKELESNFKETLKQNQELERNFKELENSFKSLENHLNETLKELETERQDRINTGIELDGKITLIDTQAAEIERLQDQLKAKDQQISFLQDHADKLTAALTAAQTLQAMERQERLQLTDQGAGLNPTPGGDQTQGETPGATAPEPVKKSLWERIFKKK